MGRRSGNEGEFKAQSYFRLLKYARPYWFRLTVGIVSGILVGGSLLVSLLMVPRLVGAVEHGTGSGEAAKFEEEAQNVVKILEQPGLTREEREKAVQELLHPVDNDPQLTKMLNEARRAAEKYGLPFSVEGREIVVSWPEYRIFLILMENKGKTVTRNQLLEQVWDRSGNYVNDNTLTVTMKRLREKLNHPACLKTIRSFGYRMEDTQ